MRILDPFVLSPIAEAALRRYCKNKNLVIVSTRITEKGNFYAQLRTRVGAILDVKYERATNCWRQYD